MKPFVHLGLLGLLSLTLGGATCFFPKQPVVQPRLETVKPIIGPSDVLEVRVFGEPELTGVYRVESDGTIRLPLVGDVDVDGITPDEAHARIELAYNGRYLKDAQVTVFVKESNSRKVVVLGEVKSPGSYPYEERMTIIGAIARAGGTGKLADLNRTLITREKDGTKVSTQVRVADIRSGRAADVEVFPGDIVYIPETLF